MSLRNWFSKTHPEGNWVRMSTKGKILGPCAREPGEGKPKCLPLAKARAMSKEDRAAAVRRKRREDPVADRSGKGGAPVNVRTEAANPAQQAAIAIALIKAGKKKGKDPGPMKEETEKLAVQKSFSYLRENLLLEKNKPTNPALWSRAIAMAKSKFDVYPSAYANGWAARWYKSKGGSWRSVSEETEPVVEQRMARSTIVETDVFGVKAYHTKCLEPGCKFESKRFSTVKQAQEAAKKHAEKEHFTKNFVKEDIKLDEACCEECLEEIVEEQFISYGNELYEDWGELEEENEGKKLNKPFLTPGGPKKRAVYVKNEKGNVVKVSFGDPNLSIKRDNPERRRSFRARHNCDNPGPKTKARYWSCKYWSSTPVSKLD